MKRIAWLRDQIGRMNIPDLFNQMEASGDSELSVVFLDRQQDPVGAVVLLVGAAGLKQLGMMEESLVWQPIETAPYGESVLVSCLGGERIIAMKMPSGKWQPDRFSSIELNPSHWLPLPPVVIKR